MTGHKRLSLGIADDHLEVFDFWQAQDAVRKWAEQQILIDEGMVRHGPYTVGDAVRDYLDDVRAEKKPEAARDAEITFNAFVLPELGSPTVLAA